MSRFTSTTSTYFNGSRLSEAIVEAGLTAAAAGFTAVIWLAAGASLMAPGDSLHTAQAVKPAVRHITLPTVVVIGKRDALEGPPAVTTAQNTAAIPVTLKQ